MNYCKIDKEDVCNGEGLRVVLWLSGCSHKCNGCHNPQTWDANSGIPFDESAKEELFRELDKDYISGLTLTGGDPLFEKNLDGVLELVTDVNKRYNATQDTVCVRDKNNNILTNFNHEIRLSSPKKSIWIYSGYTWEDILDEDYNFLEMHDTLRQAIVATNTDDLLKFAIDNGMIDMSYVQKQIEMKKREEILSKHPYKIWEGKDKKWYTYLPNKENGRILKKKTSREAIEDDVIKYWKSELEDPTITEVFEE